MPSMHKDQPKLVEMNEATIVSIDEGRRMSGNESRSSFYRALAAGELHAVKRGRRTLVTVESIRRRLRNLPKAKFGNSTPAGQSHSQKGGEQQ